MTYDYCCLPWVFQITSLQSYYFFLPFHTVLFGAKKSLYPAHTYGVGSYAPPTWGWRIYISIHNSSAWEIFYSFPCIHSFSHWFISVCTHAYLFYTLGHYPIPFLFIYCVAQIVPALALRALSVGLWVPLTYSLHYVQINICTYSKLNIRSYQCL